MAILSELATLPDLDQVPNNPSCLLGANTIVGVDNSEVRADQLVAGRRDYDGPCNYTKLLRTCAGQSDDDGPGTEVDNVEPGGLYEKGV